MKAVIEQIFFHKMFLDMMARKARKDFWRQTPSFCGTASISTGVATLIAQNLYVAGA